MDESINAPIESEVNDESTVPQVAITEGEADSDTPVDDGEIDYAAVLDADMAELRAEFPELDGMKDIYELANPVRFGALRDLGLSAREAYLASGGRRTVYDNRRHLTASVPRTAISAVVSMPRRELDMARELFGDMSDTDIQKLYRKVKG